MNLNPLEGSTHPAEPGPVDPSMLFRNQDRGGGGFAPPTNPMQPQSLPNQDLLDLANMIGLSSTQAGATAGDSTTATAAKVGRGNEDRAGAMAQSKQFGTVGALMIPSKEPSSSSSSSLAAAAASPHIDESHLLRQLAESSAKASSAKAASTAPSLPTELSEVEALSSFGDAILGLSSSSSVAPPSSVPPKAASTTTSLSPWEEATLLRSVSSSSSSSQRERAALSFHFAASRAAPSVAGTSVSSSSAASASASLGSSPPEGLLQLEAPPARQMQVGLLAGGSGLIGGNGTGGGGQDADIDAMIGPLLSRMAQGVAGGGGGGTGELLLGDNDDSDAAKAFSSVVGQEILKKGSTATLPPSHPHPHPHFGKAPHDLIAPSPSSSMAMTTTTTMNTSNTKSKLLFGGDVLGKPSSLSELAKTNLALMNAAAVASPAGVIDLTKSQPLSALSSAALPMPGLATPSPARSPAAVASSVVVPAKRKVEGGRGDVARSGSGGGGSGSGTSTATNDKISKTTTSSALDDQLIKFIVRLHSDAGTVPNADGFLPIHLACLHFPKNAKLIGTMLCTKPEVARRRVVSAAAAAQRRRSSSSSSVSSTSKGGGGGNGGLEDGGRPPPSKRSKFLNGPRTPDRRPEAEHPYDGSYPLHVALANGAPLPVVRLLVRQASDVLTKRDASGAVPLSAALRSGKCGDDVLLYLLERGAAAAGVPDARMNTPLHHACMSRSGGRVGGDGGGTNSSSSTTASKMHPSQSLAAPSMAVLRALVQAHPQGLLSRNFNGRTPLDLAQSSGTRFGDDEISYLHEAAYGEDSEEVEEPPDI